MSKIAGKLAEQQACFFLQQQGLKLVRENFYTRFGEIDLIMLDNDSYVFVEVKKRKAGINLAIESITPSKVRKLIKAAQYFMLQIGHDVNCRFDAVVLDDKHNIEWLKNIIQY